MINWFYKKLNKYTDNITEFLALLWLIAFIAFTLGLCTWSVRWVLGLWGVM